MLFFPSLPRVAGRSSWSPVVSLWSLVRLKDHWSALWVLPLFPVALSQEAREDLHWRTDDEIFL